MLPCLLVACVSVCPQIPPLISGMFHKQNPRLLLGRAPPPAAVESGCNLTIDYFLAAYLVAAKKAGDHLGQQKKIFPL